jgi:hypothetical protein
MLSIKLSKGGGTIFRKYRFHGKKERGLIVMTNIRWLGILPFIMLVLAIPFVNTVEPVVLGLPFLLFWIVLWVLLTPICLFLVYRFEPKNEIKED